MVATRSRVYGGAGARTRNRTDPAALASRLFKLRTEPQRIRRSRRMSTHPDVNQYIEDQDAAYGACSAASVHTSDKSEASDDRDADAPRAQTPGG